MGRAVSLVLAAAFLLSAPAAADDPPSDRHRPSVWERLTQLPRRAWDRLHDGFQRWRTKRSVQPASAESPAQRPSRWRHLLDRLLRPWRRPSSFDEPPSAEVRTGLLDFDDTEPPASTSAEQDAETLPVSPLRVPSPGQRR